MINKWWDYYIIRKSKLFDFRYYLKENKDVLFSDVDPLMHFVLDGWKEGRNPSGSFDTKFYLRMNPDVERSGLNPLSHYIRHGQQEGRKIKPSSALSDYFQKKDNFLPKITIIVPAFNHEKFLEERLSSLYGQTYKNFDVILLDDASTDNSRSYLQKYKDDFPDITCTLFNETNSNSPFSQWKKGLSLAQGDLIWIAESDDFCDKDFLEKLVPFFQDNSVMLAYAHTIFVDHNSNPHPFAFETYVSQVDKEKWNSSYIETSHKEVNVALGILNTIPNVSSVIFRNINGSFHLLNDPTWQKMKVCGDWLFYLNIIRGGKIAYSVETNAYYRIHSEGSSKKAQSEEIYYREHEIVAKNVASLYKVPQSLLLKLDKRLFEYYLANVQHANKHQFTRLFDINSVLRELTSRKPNILLGIYGFTFGGGEIFPIQLANALYSQGAAVTILNGGFEEYQDGVRNMLHSQIPVINYNSDIDLPLTLIEFNIEIIHTHHASMENLIASTTLSKHRSSIHIASTHGMYEMMEKFPLWTKDILKSVNHWVYTADKNLEPFIKNKIWSDKNFTKIENGLAAPISKKVDLTNLGIEEKSYIICLASRAIKEKGWYEAIDAVKIARKITDKDIHLLLIGEGPVYDDLKTKSSLEFVHLLGYKSNLSDYLVSSHLGFLPTYFRGESFPLVLIEYFFAGLPVIASRIGEIESMMTTSKKQIAGALVDLQESKVNPQDLADKIKIIITDQDYCNKAIEAVDDLKDRFNINNVALKYMNLYLAELRKA